MKKVRVESRDMHEFLAKMTDYFDGQVEPKLLAEIRGHLSECTHCEVVVSTTKQTIQIYRDNDIYDCHRPARKNHRQHHGEVRCSKSRTDHSAHYIQVKSVI